MSYRYSGGSELEIYVETTREAHEKIQAMPTLDVEMHFCTWGQAE